MIGVGRVKTPTLAIACKRELEIRDFVPVPYYEVAAVAEVEGGAFRMQHAPKDRILKRGDAEAAATAARDFEGPLGVRVEDKRQRPPRLHDLSSLQKLCSARFGWSASKTLEVAQVELTMLRSAYMKPSIGIGSFRLRRPGIMGVPPRASISSRTASKS